MDEKNLPTKAFTPLEIKNLKDLISQKGIVFEAELIKAIEETDLNDDWFWFDAIGIVKRYAKTADNAMKVNPKTWDLIPDEETRMKALDKMTKILLWQSWASKWVTVNIQNNTNLWNTWIPKPWEHLIH